MHKRSNFTLGVEEFGRPLVKLLVLRTKSLVGIEDDEDF